MTSDDTPRMYSIAYASRGILGAIDITRGPIRTPEDRDALRAWLAEYKHDPDLGVLGWSRYDD